LIQLYNRDIIKDDSYKAFHLSFIDLLDNYTVFLDTLGERFIKSDVAKQQSKERIKFIAKTGNAHEVRISTPIGKLFFDKNISVDKIFRILQYCFSFELISVDAFLKICDKNKEYFANFDEMIFKLTKFIKDNDSGETI
jgi:hypothetical protein